MGTSKLRLVSFGLALALGAFVPACAAGGGGGSSAKAVAGPGAAAPTYDAFHAKYHPHTTLAAPDNKAVQVMGYMEPASGGPILAEYLKPDADQKGKETYAIVITSLERPKAGAMIDAINPDLQARTINILAKDYALDLLFYVSQGTYDHVKGDIGALNGF